MSPRKFIINNNINIRGAHLITLFGLDRARATGPLSHTHNTHKQCCFLHYMNYRTGSKLALCPRRSRFGEVEGLVAGPEVVEKAACHVVECK